MFGRIRRVRSVVRFIRDRVPRYGPLVTDDLHRFRDERVKATVGASVSAVAGLIFVCFLVPGGHRQCLGQSPPHSRDVGRLSGLGRTRDCRAELCPQGRIP